MRDVTAPDVAILAVWRDKHGNLRVTREYKVRKVVVFDVEEEKGE